MEGGLRRGLGLFAGAITSTVAVSSRLVSSVQTTALAPSLAESESLSVACSPSIPDSPPSGQSDDCFVDDRR